ncbi:MAG: hypothetical protein JNK99_04895 [Candidatus Accumulibacter sp.]|nr:hypothetical protein [Accumulibacter sp.]MBL8394079.1 hypothetical protein [Accumulibacter sp.]
MSPPDPHTATASSHLRNPVLCTSAASRLLWAAGTLFVLWGTVFWALD